MLTLKPTSIMSATFHIHKKPFIFPHKNLPNSLPTITTTATTTTQPPLLAQQGNGENPISVVNGRGGRWWRLTPRARLVLDKGPKKILGFRGGYNKCFSFLGSKRSNFPEKKGEIFGSGSDSSSSSSGSDIVADMGSESKDHNNNHNHNGWYQDDLRTKTQSKSPLMHQNEPHRSKLLTLPTILTLGRVAAVPIFVCTFYVDNWWGTTATTSLFIAAAITDWLDGYLARKMRLGSAFGAFLDPVADKLMVAATLILLCSQPLDVFSFGRNPWLLTMPSIAIIGREITMSAVREWAASQDSKLLEAVAVNNLGKWKTATQMIALTILLACRDSSIGGPGIAVATGVILLYISAWLALWSLFVYSRKISKVLLR